MANTCETQVLIAMRRRRRKSDCPIHFALELLGDPWTLLILRDLMLKGRSRYTEFLHAEEGIATNVLADRLARLEEDGVIRRAGAGGRAGWQYSVTPKGADLLPVLLHLIAWSAKHDPRTAADPKFVRRFLADPKGLEGELRGSLLGSGEQRRRKNS
jgi:DNA-binding HxlR family transcriptional regulator